MPAGGRPFLIFPVRCQRRNVAAGTVRAGHPRCLRRCAEGRCEAADGPRTGGVRAAAGGGTPTRPQPVLTRTRKPTASPLSCPTGNLA
jgi:hypothetical protein